MVRNSIKRLLHILFIFVIPVCLFASEKDEKEIITKEYEPRLSGELYRFTLRADGKYYLYDNWVKSTILLTSGEKVIGERVKYNNYLDELIWLSSKTYKPVKLDKKLVDEFYIQLPNQREPMVFKNISFDVAFSDESRNIFAHSLYEGNISLMAHRRVIRTGERLTSVDGSLISIPRLQSDPVFYIIKDDDVAYEINRFNRWSLYRIFPEYRSEIRAAFRSERLWIRSEDDIIRAVKIIDEEIFQ